MYTRFQSVDELILAPGNKLCVKGELARGGLILSIVDLNDLSVLDTLWATRELAVSSSSKFLVYLSYSSAFTPSDFSPVVLLYDLAKTAKENRLGEDVTVENGGRPIFPPENVQVESYSPLLAEGRIGYTSPFLWSIDDTKIVFFYLFDETRDEPRRKTNFLAVVDISDGVENSRVKRKRIDLEEYVDLSEQSQDVAERIREGTFPFWVTHMEWLGDEVISVTPERPSMKVPEDLLFKLPE